MSTFLLLSRWPLFCSMLLCLTTLCCPRLAVGQGLPFIRGDIDWDGTENVTDAISILDFLFRSREPLLRCLDSADVNDDADVNIADAIYLLLSLFTSDHPLKPPYPTPGFDPSDDDLCCPCKPYMIAGLVVLAESPVVGATVELRSLSTGELLDTAHSTDSGVFFAKADPTANEAGYALRATGGFIEGNPFNGELKAIYGSSDDLGTANLTPDDLVSHVTP